MLNAVAAENSGDGQRLTPAGHRRGVAVWLVALKPSSPTPAGLQDLGTYQNAIDSVIVDRAHQAATIVGFADRFEIPQRIQDALAVR